MLVAATTVSLGGLSESVAGEPTQDTDPLEGSDVSVSFAGITMSFGSASLTFEDGTMEFRARDWTAEGPERSLSGDRMRATVEEVSAETYADVRAATVETLEDDSPLPLLIGIAKADIDSDASVEVSARGVGQDDRSVADRITATGQFGAVVPDELRTVSKRTLLGDVTEVGDSKWDEMTVQRGDTELTFADVVITPQLSETVKTERDPHFDVTFGEISRDGDQLVSNFEISGTLTELLRALQRGAPVDTGGQTDDGDDDQPDDSEGDGQPLSRVAIVSSPDTDATMEYVFEVTGGLEKLEPNEDAGPAVDTVTDTGDRMRVEGAVNTGDDRFAFSGELVEVDVPSGVEIEINER